MDVLGTYLYLFKRISLSLFLKDLILLSFRRELSREFHSFGPVYLVVLWASDERVNGMWKREAWRVEYECTSLLLVNIEVRHFGNSLCTN